MQIAIAQHNAIVGDLRGNASRLLAAAHHAKDAGAQLLVTPELALCGYPPRDLCDRPGFVTDCLRALTQLIDQAPIPMLVGSIVAASGDPREAMGRIANGAVLMHKGEVLACHRKMLLPNYDVFDELRYFVPGTDVTVVPLLDLRLGITVCEDIWNDKGYWEQPRYPIDPVGDTVAAGVDLIVNLSASPYDRHKPEVRSAMVRALVQKHSCPILYVNQVGGNDSLIFDGRSLGVSVGKDGEPAEITMRAAAFREVLASVHVSKGRIRGEIAADASCWEEDICEALCTGLSDYVRKCGFSQVVLGLSGGIDSAITAALAVRALGAARVLGVAMPSRYSSQGSIDDALDLAKRLGIRCDTVPIEPIFAGFLHALAGPFKDMPEDVTEENLQARARGTLLMAYANKFGGLLLTTGNKSELAVGYCTLYGDMNGGLGLISDLYKTEVYAIANYLNSQSEPGPIPPSTITKPPSAELRPGQTDQDSLPPYDTLDAILRGHVDAGQSVEVLSEAGFDPALVRRIAGMVARSEYKRRQMAQGLRVSGKAFGEGRRLPVAQRYGL